MEAVNRVSCRAGPAAVTDPTPTGAQEGRGPTRPRVALFWPFPGRGLSSREDRAIQGRLRVSRFCMGRGELEGDDEIQLFFVGDGEMEIIITLLKRAVCILRIIEKKNVYDVMSRNVST